MDPLGVCVSCVVRTQIPYSKTISAYCPFPVHHPFQTQLWLSHTTPEQETGLSRTGTNHLARHVLGIVLYASLANSMVHEYQNRQASLVCLWDAELK